jgi:serine/threonine protein kinase
MMTDFMGQTIGRYRILELLGEGGMATVYKALDTHLEREVAIKFIRWERLGVESGEVVRKRFKREARVLAKLSHPNILTVHDYGEHEGQLYLVTGYVPNGSLKGRMGSPVPWAEAVHLLAPIARALEYAHGQNVLHRDIKPSNILLSSGGLPILADFGLAKVSERDETGSIDESTDTDLSQLTRTGVGLGTPEYMAPEQWDGQADQRSDIYSLGVVFYALVTGRMPYTAKTAMGMAIMQASQPLTPPGKVVPGLPGRVEQVIVKALAKEPGKRFQTMSEFAEALDGLSGGGKPILTPRAAEAESSTLSMTLSSLAGSVKRPEKTKMRWAIAVGSAAIVLLGLVFVLKPVWFPLTTPPTPSPTSTPMVIPTRTSIPTPTIDLEGWAYGALKEVNSTSPLYETRFDQLGPDWRAINTAKIKDGKLIVSSNDSGSPYPSREWSYWQGAGASIISSDKFAVQYEFRFLDVSGTDAACSFEASNDNKYNGKNWKRQVFLFGYFGIVGLDKNLNGSFDAVIRKYTSYDYSRSNLVTVILNRGHMAAIINDQLVYTAIDDSRDTIYSSYFLSAAYDAVCEFDSLKVWILASAP